MTALSALAAFATILTLAMPYLQSDRLSARLKAVATQREELRKKHREAVQKKASCAPRPSAS